MKKQSFLLGFFILVTALGCTKKEKTYTQQEMQHIVDSIVQQRAIYLKEQAKTDLELRLPIEIKPKLDSLQHQNMSIDTPPRMDTVGNNVVLPNDSDEADTTEMHKHK